MSEISVSEVRLEAASACAQGESPDYLALHLLDVSSGQYKNDFPLLDIADTKLDPTDHVGIVSRAIEVLGPSKVRPHPATGLLAIDVLNRCSRNHAEPQFERVVSLVLAAAGAERQHAGFRRTHFGVGVYPAVIPFGMRPIESAVKLIESPGDLMSHQINGYIKAGPFWQGPPKHITLRGFETIVPAKQLDQFRERLG